MIILNPQPQYTGHQQEACEEGLMVLDGEVWSKDMCYRYYAGTEMDYQYCAEIDELRKKDECYSDLGKYTKNSYVCTLISFEQGTQTLRDDCYSQVAIQLSESVYCDSVIYRDTKDACYVTIAINKLQAALCDNVVGTDGVTGRYYCYFHIAKQTYNRNLCEKIDKHNDMYDQCVYATS